MATTKKTSAKKADTKKAGAKKKAVKKTVKKASSTDGKAAVARKVKTKRARARVKAAAARAPVPKKAVARKKAIRKASKKALKRAAVITSGVAPATSALRSAKSDLRTIMDRVRSNYVEAAVAVSQTNGKLEDARREVMFAILENTQENTDRIFDALRDMVDADSLGDALRIQREVVVESVEQMLQQVKDVSSLAADKGKDSVTPVGEYISKLRDKGE